MLFITNFIYNIIIFITIILNIKNYYFYLHIKITLFSIFSTAIQEAEIFRSFGYHRVIILDCNTIPSPTMKLFLLST